MCNSAVQCGSTVDESTKEYLAKVTTAISPSFPEGRGRLYTGCVSCSAERGVREVTIRYTWIHDSLCMKFSFSLYFKYLYLIFGNNWVNGLDTDKETLILPCYLYRFFSNCFQRYRMISLKWPELNRIGCILRYRKLQLFDNNALLIGNALYLSRQNRRFWTTMTSSSHTGKECLASPWSYLAFC